MPTLQSSPFFALASLLSSIAASITLLSITHSAFAQQSHSRAADLQRTIDSIAAAEEAGQDAAPNFHHFRIIDVSPDVRWAHINHAALPAHGRLNVDITVQTSAQLGGLYLSCGDIALQTTVGFCIGGNLGVQQLFVASGTTVGFIADVINYYSPVTGVIASAAPTGIFLQSASFGRTEFVSVRIIDFAAPTETGAIYRLQRDDATTPDPRTGIPFSSPLAHRGVIDPGQDLCATVNGLPAASHGPLLLVRSPHLSADIELTTGPAMGPANAQTLGTFRAFTVIRR